MIREMVFQDALVLDRKMGLGHIVGGRVDVKLLNIVKKMRSDLNGILRTFSAEVDKALLVAMIDPQCVAMRTSQNHKFKSSILILELRIALCGDLDEDPFSGETRQELFVVEEILEKIEALGGVDKWLESKGLRLVSAAIKGRLDARGEVIDALKKYQSLS